MKQEDPDVPLIIQFTNLVHERRRAGPEDRECHDQNTQTFVEEHKDNRVFQSRAKIILAAARLAKRQGGDGPQIGR